MTRSLVEQSLLISLLVWTSASAMAETSVFTDATGNHLWSDPHNWSDGVPDAPIDRRGEFAFLSADHGQTGKYALIDYGAPSFWAIRLAQEGPNPRLVMAPGGSLTISHLIMGSTTHGGGLLDMRGGRLRCELSCIVSHQGDPGAVVVLGGGELSAARLTIGQRGRVDIRGGRLVVDGDLRDTMADHVDERRIMAFGASPGAEVNMEYEVGSDRTVLTASGGPAPVEGCVEGPGRPLEVMLMGDPQLYMGGEESLEHVTTAMVDVAHLDHDLLVPLGDLVQNRAEYYRDYQDLILNRSTRPVYSIGGNADRNAGLEAYQDATGLPLNYVVWFRGIRFVFLSVVETSGGHNHICHMGQDQVDWLRDELEADTTSTTAIFFHAPVFETTFRSGDRSDEPPPMSLYLSESEQVQGLLRTHENVVLYASAHIHPFRYGREDDEGRGGYALEDGVLHTIVGTTANNKGSRVLYVERNRLRIRVRDHETESWLAEHEYEYVVDTTLQPEVDRICNGVPPQSEPCPEGCAERRRHCDPHTCTWSAWTDCGACSPDDEPQPDPSGGEPGDVPELMVGGVESDEVAPRAGEPDPSTMAMEIGGEAGGGGHSPQNPTGHGASGGPPSLMGGEQSSLAGTSAGTESRATPAQTSPDGGTPGVDTPASADAGGAEGSASEKGPETSGCDCAYAPKDAPVTGLWWFALLVALRRPWRR